MQRLNGAGQGDFIDVADAVAAYEATGASVRSLQDWLDRLRSGTQYARRFSHGLAAPSDQPAA